MGKKGRNASGSELNPSKRESLASRLKSDLLSITSSHNSKRNKEDAEWGARRPREKLFIQPIQPVWYHGVPTPKLIGRLQSMEGSETQEKGNVSLEWFNQMNVIRSRSKILVTLLRSTDYNLCLPDKVKEMPQFTEILEGSKDEYKQIPKLNVLCLQTVAAHLGDYDDALPAFLHENLKPDDIAFLLITAAILDTITDSYVFPTESSLSNGVFLLSTSKVSECCFINAISSSSCTTTPKTSVVADYGDYNNWEDIYTEASDLEQDQSAISISDSVTDTDSGSKKLISNLQSLYLFGSKFTFATFVSLRALSSLELLCLHAMPPPNPSRSHKSGANNGDKTSCKNGTPGIMELQVPPPAPTTVGMEQRSLPEPDKFAVINYMRSRNLLPQQIATELISREEVAGSPFCAPPSYRITIPHNIFEKSQKSSTDVFDWASGQLLSRLFLSQEYSTTLHGSDTGSDTATASTTCDYENIREIILDCCDWAFTTEGLLLFAIRLAAQRPHVAAASASASASCLPKLQRLTLRGCPGVQSPDMKPHMRSRLEDLFKEITQIELKLL